MQHEPIFVEGSTSVEMQFPLGIVIHANCTCGDNTCWFEMYVTSNSDGWHQIIR